MWINFKIILKKLKILYKKTIIFINLHLNNENISFSYKILAFQSRKIHYEIINFLKKTKFNLKFL